MKVIGIAGSIVGSKTRATVEKVLDNVKKFSPEVEVELVDLKDYQLDFCDGRHYTEYEGDTKTLINQLMEADAYIIGTPIFQASIPGALKNMFDVLPVDTMMNKTAGMIATAGSSKHHLVVEHQLKPILSYMKAMVLPQYVFIEEEYFDEKKEITNGEILYRLEKLAEDVIEMGKRIRKTHG
ncbi:NADPH-dependent FMN reductase [Virgibacillus xinjiangensis]|uniref:NADPH-dependent FMN reductase n=1 Tax=Virgibacillus xinjiangensis TaxID=393090 RepID=A0ABV7CXQ5_9BACI